MKRIFWILPAAAMSAPSSAAPGLGTTTATTASPKSGCGTPTTADSATFIGRGKAQALALACAEKIADAAKHTPKAPVRPTRERRTPTPRSAPVADAQIPTGTSE